MKIILSLVIVLALFFTLGCNYDYGKYGKDKTDKNTEQKSEAGTPSN